MTFVLSHVYTQRKMYLSARDAFYRAIKQLQLPSNSTVGED